MSKSGHPLRSVLLVTVSVLGILVLAFALYFLLFMIMERVVRRGDYNFVSMLRGGFGIVFSSGGRAGGKDALSFVVQSGVFWLPRWLYSPSP